MASVNGHLTSCKCAFFCQIKLHFQLPYSHVQQAIAIEKNPRLISKRKEWGNKPSIPGCIEYNKCDVISNIPTNSDLEVSGASILYLLWRQRWILIEDKIAGACGVIVVALAAAIGSIFSRRRRMRQAAVEPTS